MQTYYYGTRRWLQIRTINKVLDNKKALSIVKELTWNVSLPIAIFSQQGKLLWANPRMLSLLDLDQLNSKPLSKEEIEARWSFSNDEKGPPAILANLLKSSCVVEAHANLKNYKLKSEHIKKESLVVVCAELKRSGDLLHDKESRQLLFRLISHEVRTSVAALKGYVEMISDDQEIIKDRMKVGLERLEKVVGLLRDLKIELEIED